MKALAEGSFCTGIDGIGIAVRNVFGCATVWHCEYDPAPSKVLAHHFPGIPNHGDLTATDWTQVEPVDIVTAGYPCQPFSTAGQRQGTDDERHLWPAIRDALSVLRPRIFIAENVRGHISLGFDQVLADLAGLGFDAEWCIVRSSDIGAPHRRERLFVVASDPDRMAGPETGKLGDREQVITSGVRAGIDQGRRHGIPAIRGESVSESSGVDRPFADTYSESAGRDTGTAFGAETGREDDPRRTDRHGSTHGNATATDTDGGRFESDTELHVPSGGRRARRNNDARRGPDRERVGDGAGTDWGKYTGAVRRWEHITGRRAPDPLVDAKSLNPALPEWMMGYPPGWVTDPAIGLTRAQQLKAIGNAVQPQAAELAIRHLAVRAGLIEAQVAA